MKERGRLTEHKPRVMVPTAVAGAIVQSYNRTMFSYSFIPRAWPWQVSTGKYVSR